MYLALTLVLTIGLVTGAFTSETVPIGVLLVGDHTMFIGVMTNALLGLLQDGTREQKAFRPWENDVIYWGTNVGLIGFISGLITGVTFFERLFTPIMGLSLLLAIAVYATLLIRRPSGLGSQPRSSEFEMNAKSLLAFRHSLAPGGFLPCLALVGVAQVEDKAATARIEPASSVF